MSNPKETAKERLLTVIKHLRFAMKEAEAGGKVQLGILSVLPDSSGKITARFDAKDFIEDVALVIGAPPYTENDEMEAKATKLLHELGM